MVSLGRVEETFPEKSTTTEMCRSRGGVVRYTRRDTVTCVRRSKRFRPENREKTHSRKTLVPLTEQTKMSRVLGILCSTQ